ncbi:T9SS C-terminal target domain-containing protein [Chryseobacterium carnipullorum]|uniref:Delta-60 repeat domain n=1 Tax=Chryseobacterium carnipullorum TaxID=1124835 RepID=A0A376DPW0_CHRCU|nr:T9SS type A sorting domain-containing protein [Chryseobacterium carnipullorum]AZA48882.1 T9SS C-terminal target domain-containing protein [Chryseobacterium carnipullorum]AZA63787.1 T9SS C-terminal target domain-containing protein [Chryseobacterium carnipullorum]STC93431.1 delta-60 repeat domain [Chryseobacterium carnipullorum]
MNKLFTSVAMVASFYSNINAQTINLDPNFGSGGIVSLPLNGEADDLQITLSSDNKILAYGKDIITSGNVNPNKIYKLNLDGTLNTNFGNAGILTLPDYIGDFIVLPQGNGKILVTFQRTSGSASSETSILRYDLNGILDNSFGNNGEFKTSYNGPNGFRSNNAVVLSDLSIILATGSQFIKLTPNGSIDTSYGNNGSISQVNSGNIQLSNSNILAFYDHKIDKITSTLTPVSTFGTNGTFTYPDSGSYFSKQATDNSIYTLDLDGNTFYNISSNGNLSSTVLLTDDNNSLDFYSNFDFSGNKIYFVGTTSAEIPFIVSYDHSGNLVPLNSQNSYKETSLAQGNYTSVLAKDNVIYVGGDQKDLSTNKWYYVVTKYNVSTSTLSANGIQPENSISFENPAQSHLVYSSKEKVRKIELYSTDGKLLKIITENHSNISDLSKGVYLLKAEFDHGKIVTRKLIKN